MEIGANVLERRAGGDFLSLASQLLPRLLHLVQPFLLQSIECLLGSADLRKDEPERGDPEASEMDAGALGFRGHHGNWS